jgi:LemA protein
LPFGKKEMQVNIKFSYFYTLILKHTNMKRSSIIILVIIAILGIWAYTTRNGMALAKNDINGLWGKVQAQYNRKAKLYENVVSTIKGAARNEDTTLIKIVKMRSGVPDINENSTPEQVAAADKQLSSVGRAALNVNIEAYPTLQATGLYKDLQAQIEGTENRVTTALNDWNNGITSYNAKVISFPGNLLAGLFGYTAMKNYEAEAGAENTKTDFSK